MSTHFSCWKFFTSEITNHETEALGRVTYPNGMNPTAFDISLVSPILVLCLTLWSHVSAVAVEIREEGAWPCCHHCLLSGSGSASGYAYSSCSLLTGRSWKAFPKFQAPEIMLFWFRASIPEVLSNWGFHCLRLELQVLGTSENQPLNKQNIAKCYAAFLWLTTTICCLNVLLISKELDTECSITACAALNEYRNISQQWVKAGESYDIMCTTPVFKVYLPLWLLCWCPVCYLAMEYNGFVPWWLDEQY